MPNYHSSEMLFEYRKMLAKPQYNAITSAFEKLWGENKEDQI